jgi:hypothetical protein
MVDAIDTCPLLIQGQRDGLLRLRWLKGIKFDLLQRRDCLI